MARRLVRSMGAATAAVLALTLVCDRAVTDAMAPFREMVVRAGTREQKGAAYQAYFLHVGRAGLKELMKDQDTGIALQAAWETCIQPAKRKDDAGGRTDDVYDRAGLVKFVAFLKDRIKVGVPDWWAAAITKVDVFPDRHHAFIRPHAAKAGPKDCKVQLEGDTIVCSSGGRFIKFPKETFDEIAAGSFVGWLGDRQSVVASYPTSAGFEYQVTGFVGKNGKPDWRAEVWSAGRQELFGDGFHQVEMTERDGVVYLFGMESHGAYVEAFEVATGKVRFRFCTCYWFHFSEAWGLK